MPGDDDGGGDVGDGGGDDGDVWAPKGTPYLVVPFPLPYAYYLPINSHCYSSRTRTNTTPRCPNVCTVGVRKRMARKNRDCCLLTPP